MRKFQFTQLVKTGAAFGIVATITVDSWIAVADIAAYDIPPEYYALAPLAVIGLGGIPATIALASRLADEAYKKPGSIQTVSADVLGNPGRSIPWNRNGRLSTIMTNTSRTFMTPQAELEPVREVRVSWRVPVGDTEIVVGETELTKFLELAARRTKYHFSRRYWVERRRPAMPRARYEAVMQLLSSAGLIASRQSGASGYLVGNLKPHNAISFLKYESIYRI